MLMGITRTSLFVIQECPADSDDMEENSWLGPVKIIMAV